MDYVSLLPPEIKQRRIDELRQDKINKLVVIVLAIVLAVYIFLLVSSLLARNSLQSLQEERRDLETQAAALQEYADLYEDMSETEDRLNRAMGNVPDWNQFMFDLAMALNPEGAISELNLAYEAGTTEDNDNNNNNNDNNDNAEVESSANQGYFDMRGKSYSHGNVGDVLERIQELEQLADVRFRISSETMLNNRPAVEFTVDARLLPGPVFFDPDGEGN